MKSQLSYTRNTVDKITVKGVLSSDGTEITYIDADKEEQVVAIDDCLKAFRNCDISFSVSKSKNEDLDIDSSDE